MQVGVGRFGNGGYLVYGREFVCSDPASDPASDCGVDCAGDSRQIELGAIVTDLFSSIDWGVDFSGLFLTVDLLFDVSEFVYFIVRGFIDEIGGAGG